jgi:hypothetical protein
VGKKKPKKLTRAQKERRHRQAAKNRRKRERRAANRKARHREGALLYLDGRRPGPWLHLQESGRLFDNGLFVRYYLYREAAASRPGSRSAPIHISGQGRWSAGSSSAARWRWATPDVMPAIETVCVIMPGFRRRPDGTLEEQPQERTAR